MSSRLPQGHSSCTGRVPAVATAAQQPGVQDADQHSECPYGSPIAGVCTASPAAQPAASSIRAKLRFDKAATGHLPGLRASDSPGSYLAHNNSASQASSMRGQSWPIAQQPGHSTLGQQSAGQQHKQQHRDLRLSADNTARRDQDMSHNPDRPSPRSSQAGLGALRVQSSTVAGGTDGQLVEQPVLPVDVLLSPLLPSADEAKLVDRLSQLRHALDEHIRLATGWEQQAVALQQALSEAQDEALVLRGQVASQQHHISLLGGNLQGRLSLVQGTVLAELQEQVAHKDSALADSAQHVMAMQTELERLSCSFSAKLAAEQAERQRLSAEAAQARLLCTARGRQVSSMQQELQQLKEAADQQQQTMAASRGLQQQQMETLQQRLQDVQQQLAAAHQEATDAQQTASAAEGGKAGLRQQVEELQALLADKQLQVDWLEGKVADLEGSDINQQLRHRHMEVARVQEAAAADRKALEQQVAAAQRQLSQLQSQDEEWRQHAAQLEQQVQQLQQQLEQQSHVTEELQQLLQQREQQALAAQADSVQQLAVADTKAQQLREQLAQAEGQLVGLAQHQQLHAAHVATESAAGDAEEDADQDDSSPLVPAAALHALRAELGIANAEIARLRHQLDVAQASQQQERELTGHEILRLQQELSEAAASGSGDAVTTTPAAAAIATAPAQADGAGMGEVTSRLGAQGFGSSSTSSWHSVHDNPAFEQQQQQQQLGLTEQAAHDVVAESAAAPAVVADAAVKLLRYEAKLQDQAETISSLQRQLRQQEQLLVALHKPERRVFDSAASKGSWAEALGFHDSTQNPLEQGPLRHLPAAAGAATGGGGGAAGSVSEPATPHADAAVQTDLSGPAESAGSTAAVQAATADDSSDGLPPPRQQRQQEREQQASSRQQGTASGSDAAAGSALLAAARHEILRLQELNRQLMQAHAEELKASVSFEDARRAVSEAKQHAKAKAAALLQASNKAWTDKLAAARAQTEILQEQLQQLQHQRDQLAQQAHSAEVLQLRQQLSAAAQQTQSLQRQLQDMAVSHLQELEQVRMEVEADAAAAMLDAAAASSTRQQQQHLQQQRWQKACHVAVQTEAVMTAPLQDAAAQTDVAHEASSPSAVVGSEQQQQQDVSPNVAAQHQLQQQLQHTASPDDASNTPGCLPQSSSEHVLQQQGLSSPGQEQQQWLATQACTSSVADNRPCTPQPTVAAAATAAAANTAGGLLVATSPAHPQPTSSTAETPQQRVLAPWRSAAAAAVGTTGGGGGGDLADDDICRFSSASDTPASASSRAPVSRLRGSSGPGAFGPETQRPGSAGAVSLPELTATSSPVAPSSTKPVTHRQQRERSAALQQQQQQQQGQSRRQHPTVPSQQAQQQQQQAGLHAADSGSVQMSSWHAELLQQQAELEALKARLSSQQQQQQPSWRPSAGVSSSSRSNPAVASSRTLLLAPLGPSLAAATAPAAAGVGGNGVMGSPAGPVFSSSSPMTYQQRRAAAGVQPPPAAAPAAASSSFPAGADSAAVEHPTHLLYTQQQLAGAIAGQALSQVQQGASSAAAAAAADGSGFAAVGYPRWRSSSSPDGLLTDGLLLGSPQVHRASSATAASRGLLAAADTGSPGVTPGTSSGWGMSLMAAAAAAAAASSRQLGRSLSPPAAASYRAAAAAAPAGLAAAAAAAGSAATAAGLSKLGDDVLGALSLSRYHRERSKLQEARAKQHALLASHHEDQADAVRNSRLGPSPAIGAAAGSNPAAGSSPGSQRAWASSGAAAGSTGVL